MLFSIDWLTRKYLGRGQYDRARYIKHPSIHMCVLYDEQLPESTWAVEEGLSASPTLACMINYVIITCMYSLQCHTQIHTYIHTQTYTHMNVHRTRLAPCQLLIRHTHTHTHTRTHTHTHARTHTRTHARTQARHDLPHNVFSL